METTITANIICNAKIEGELHLPLFNASVYEGSYDVTPKANETQILNTANKVMTDNITVFEIPYYEVSNESGKTVYIGKEIITND